MTQTIDQTLVERFLEARSEAAFLGLYRRHTQALYATAFRLVGGRSESAEDVVQETWIRAIERLDRFEWRSSLRTWLTGIAVNCAREKWRHDSRRPASIDEVQAATRTTSISIDRVARIDLERAIGRLPDGYRDVLVLHDIEGFSHVEIGSMLGTQAVTSRSQLHRARRALREILFESHARSSMDERT